MSVHPQPPPGTPGQPPPQPQPQPQPPQDTEREDEVWVYQHSMLFYWWPVWAVGFLMALLTFFLGGHMAVVPGDAQLQAEGSTAWVVRVPVKNPNEIPARVRPTQENPNPPAVKVKDAGSPYDVHISSYGVLGLIWSLVLLLTIFITNVPLRGMWFWLILVAVLLLGTILYMSGILHFLLGWFMILDIHINMAGYIFISAVLLIIWVVAVFLFDRQTYWVFRPGQVEVVEQIGGGAKTYGTMGMTIEHLRDDPLRHWVLGLGSGDLVVRTSGAESHVFHIHNVLFASTKLNKIQEMQREVAAVPGTKTTP